MLVSQSLSQYVLFRSKCTYHYFVVKTSNFYSLLLARQQALDLNETTNNSFTYLKPNSTTVWESVQDVTDVKAQTSIS